MAFIDWFNVKFRGWTRSRKGGVAMPPWKPDPGLIKALGFETEEEFNDWARAGGSRGRGVK